MDQGFPINRQRDMDAIFKLGTNAMSVGCPFGETFYIRNYFLIRRMEDMRPVTVDSDAMRIDEVKTITSDMIALFDKMNLVPSFGKRSAEHCPVKSCANNQDFHHQLVSEVLPRQEWFKEIHFDLI
jgi:hypothetical protein